MITKKKQWLTTVLIILLVAGSVTIFFAIQKEHVYNHELFGISEPITFRHVQENLDIQGSFETLKQLGVRRLREWVWASSFLVNQSVVNHTFEDAMSQVLAKAQANNVAVMGMSQDFPSWMTGIENDSQTVPSRNTATGSDYMLFLERYRASWRTIAQVFQNITVWEIGNEFNIDAFLHPQGFNPVSQSPVFSAQEKADITTDLLYYGSLGIREGNPNATTVLGGLARCPNIADIAVFLEKLYVNIESGQWPSINTNDYFQEVSWHPYLVDVEPTESNWISPNEAIYTVMKQHGDEEKRVVFSEFGYSDERVSQEVVQNCLLKAFQFAKDNFPWLETIYWFRLIDPQSDTISEVNPPGYGMISSDWTWKPVAHAYQSLAQESGNSSNGCLLAFSDITTNSWDVPTIKLSDAFKARTCKISEARGT